MRKVSPSPFVAGGVWPSYKSRWAPNGRIAGAKGLGDQGL